jgi:hypothetical protein
MLVSARSSRYRESLQENLRLLSAPEGEILTLRLPLSRLEPGLAGAALAGLPLAFALGEPPFARPAVVRLGRVAQAREEEDRLTLQVRLAGVPEARAAARLEAWLAGRFEAGSRRLLGLPEDAPGLPEAPAGEVEAAWRAAIDRLLASEAGARFARSVFLRVGELIDSDQGVAAEPLLLQTRRVYALRLQCHTPHLAPEARAACGLGAGYDRTELELEALESPGAGGLLTLRFRALVPGTARLHLFVRPDPELGTRLTLELHATGPQAERAPACDEAAQAALGAGLVDVWGLLGRLGLVAEPEAERQVLETLTGLVPEEPELARALALCHHRAGRHGAALRLFDGLGAAHLLPGDRLPHLLSACRAGPATDRLLELVGRLAWDQVDAARAEALGRAVAELPERTLVPVLEALAYHGTEHFLADIWRAVRHAVRTPDALLGTLTVLAETELMRPGELAGYLAERLRALGLQDARLDERLVALGLEAPDAPPGFGDSLGRAARALVEAGRGAEAVGLVGAARARLSPAAHESQRLALAEALLAAEGEERAGLAAGLWLDAAEAARLRGDLDEALELAERAALAAPGFERLAPEQAALERAVQAAEPFGLLGEALLGQRLKALRDALAGGRLVVVGGPAEKPWVEELRRELALAEVTWFPSRLGEPPRAEKVRDALSGTASAVAVLTFYVGHQVAEAVREEARRRELPCAFVTSGTSKAALLRALLRAGLGRAEEPRAPAGRKGRRSS